MGRFLDRRFGGGTSVNPVTVALESGGGQVVRYSFKAVGSNATVQFKDDSGNVGSAISVSAGQTVTGPSSTLEGDGRLYAEVTFDASGFRGGSAYLETDIETVSDREVDLEPWAPALSGADCDIFASDGAGGVKLVGSGTYGARRVLYLPGVADNYASTPDDATLDITGDLDLRVWVALDDWTPASDQQIISKYTSGAVSWSLRVDSTGKLRFNWSADGSSLAAGDKISSVVPGASDGTFIWVRVTLDVDNGSSGNDVKFYTSADYDDSAGTQLGTTQTTAGTTSIANTATPVEVGTRSAGSTQPAAGKFGRALILNGIGGTEVADLNALAASHPRYRDEHGRVWTFNGSSYSWMAG